MHTGDGRAVDVGGDHGAGVKWCVLQGFYDFGIVAGVGAGGAVDAPEGGGELVFGWGGEGFGAAVISDFECEVFAAAVGVGDVVQNFVAEAGPMPGRKILGEWNVAVVGVEIGVAGPGQFGLVEGDGDAGAGRDGLPAMFCSRIEGEDFGLDVAGG